MVDRATRRQTYRAISGGTTFICIGTILLLNTLDILEWGVWLDLLRLWPVLLISLGIRMLFIETALHPLCLVGPVLVVLATVWAADRFMTRVDAQLDQFDDVETVALECPAPSGGDPAHLDLGFEGGRLLLTSRAAADPQAGDSPPSQGFHGEVRFSGENPSPTCDDDGDLRMGRKRRRRKFHMVLPLWEDWENYWETVLTSAAPVGVDVELERTTGEMDLRGLPLDRVALDTRASTVVVNLGPPRGVVPVRIDGAVSKLTLTVPEDTCFTVTRERRLSILKVEDSLKRTRRRRRLTADSCPDGKADGPRYEIRYDLPLSYVSVQTEDLDT